MDIILDTPLKMEDFAFWLGELDLTVLQDNGWTREDLSKAYQNHPHWVLYNSSQVMTSCLIYHQLEPSHSEIIFVATAPRWQRKGYVQQLLQHLLKSESVAKVWLECRENNQFALSLYKKCGFVENGRRKNYYNDGRDAILMEYSKK